MKEFLAYVNDPANKIASFDLEWRMNAGEYGIFRNNLDRSMITIQEKIYLIWIGREQDPARSYSEDWSGNFYSDLSQDLDQLLIDALKRCKNNINSE